MAMNKVQFQAGLSLPAFTAKFGSEAQCRKALFSARWPEGFRCPACAGSAHSTFKRDGQIRVRQLTFIRHMHIDQCEVLLQEELVQLVNAEIDIPVTVTRQIEQSVVRLRVGRWRCCLR